MLWEVNASADTTTRARSRGTAHRSTAQHRRHDSYVTLSQKKERMQVEINGVGGQ